MTKTQGKKKEKKMKNATTKKKEKKEGEGTKITRENIIYVTYMKSYNKQKFGNRLKNYFCLEEYA